MDDAVRLCPGEGVTEYFRELVDDVAGQQRLGLDPMTSYYVVQLLATFARTDADGVRGRSGPSSRWARCSARPSRPAGPSSAGGCGRSGDASLVLTGLFPNRLSRSLVDVDYYMRIGGIAYDSLSHDEADLFSPAFGELASRFGDVVDLLGDVGDRCQLGSPADLLRLYERWQKTGSAHCARRLVVPRRDPGGPGHAPAPLTLSLGSRAASCGTRRRMVRRGLPPASWTVWVSVVLPRLVRRGRSCDGT